MDNTVTKSQRELRVSPQTNVGKLAASIKNFRMSNPSENLVLRYIGAGAGGQALKGVIIANRMLKSIRQEYCLINPLFGESTDGASVMIFELSFFPINFNK